MPPATTPDGALDLIAFLDASPTPYHAVAETKRRLIAAGFTEIDECADWTVASGARHFLTRAGGTIVAFEIGSRAPSEAGFLLLGAHTDSPNLRLKPAPDVTGDGYAQLGAEVYGGVLRHTWLDRDLSIAGRVALGEGRNALVRFEGSVCRIPSLAIHLDRTPSSDGLKLNPQKHLVPIVGLETKDAPAFRARLAAELSRTTGTATSAEDIVGFDLCLFDTQGASVGGIAGELLSSSRLDNLTSCHAALQGLLGSQARSDATRVVALYDHEEVGSQSAAGAKSRFLVSVLERLALGCDASPQAPARALARSLLVSLDMAHAVHPNYADKHDAEHRPALGAGPVIKLNANQSYATDAHSQGVFEEACRASGVKPQYFVSRNDQPCGSTIGPISAARMGVRTVDAGSPMLGMHSCRETAGTADVHTMIEVVKRLLAVSRLPPPAA